LPDADAIRTLLIKLESPFDEPVDGQGNAQKIGESLFF